MIDLKKIWDNGKLVDTKDAMIHPLAHVVHYGSNIFEGIRCYQTEQGPAIFRLPEHVKRLLDSAKIMHMPTGFNQEEWEQAIIDTVTANEIRFGYIRPNVFRDLGGIGLDPTPVKIRSQIMCWEWGAYLGEDALKNGIRCVVSSLHRPSPEAFMTKAKCGGVYVNSVIAKLLAKKEGYDEAIMAVHDGFMSEGTGENLFIVRDNIIYTPPKAIVLEGITRDSLITLAQDELGLEVREEEITRDQLYKADEVFLCGTAAEVTPVREIDDIEIGSGSRGPVTEQLQSLFFDIVAGKNDKYKKWLTYI